MSTVPVTVPAMGRGSEVVLTTWTLSGGGIGDGVGTAFCAWADAAAQRVTSRAPNAAASVCLNFTMMASP
jgi:hypothetical protein